MSEPCETDLGRTQPGLRITLDTIAPEVLVCALAGEVDLATGPRLEQELADALAHSSSHLVVDLSEVVFLGSIGLRILVEIKARQYDDNRHLAVVVSDNRKAERPLKVTGLDQELDMHHELTTAVKACFATHTETSDLNP